VKEEEREDHMIMAKIAYCRPVIELVMEELEETSSLSSSSAQGVDSLELDKMLVRAEKERVEKRPWFLVTLL